LATKRRNPMLERNIKCPKCQRAIQKGYIPDATCGVVLGTWIGGEVETGFLGAIKLKGKTRRRITTYRCNSCGYLESYAAE
jgi:predicted nucleic-acid-binding Zn-ribbon protein